MSNSLVNNNNNQAKPKTISSFMCEPAIKNRIVEIMGKDSGQFITSIVAAVNQTPALAECEMMSIFNAAMQIQALKLSPSPVLGQAYMIPFKNNKLSKIAKKDVKEAKFVMGYIGYIQLAIRSGYYKRINVLELKQGELKKFNPMTEEIEVSLIEDEDERENTPTTHYYASFEYQNGFQKALCWSKTKMLLHACKYVPFFTRQDYDNFVNGLVKKEDEWKLGYWHKDFDGQAKKTMIRQLISKWGIMSVELQQAVESDIESEEPKASNDFIDIQNTEPDRQQAEPPVYQENNNPDTEYDPFNK